MVRWVHGCDPDGRASNGIRGGRLRLQSLTRLRRFVGHDLARLKTAAKQQQCGNKNARNPMVHPVPRRLISGEYVQAQQWQERACPVCAAYLHSGVRGMKKRQFP